jgi:hypothetical protein
MVKMTGLAVPSRAEVPQTMKRIFLPFTVLLACGALLGACGDDDDDNGGAAGSAPEPTLTAIQAEILTPVCATSGCHGGVSAPSLKAGESFNAIVGKDSALGSSKKLVVAGKPEESLLYLLLQGPTDDISKMPLSGKLTDAQIESVRAWIAAGAKND